MDDPDHWALAPDYASLETPSTSTTSRLSASCWVFHAYFITGGFRRIGHRGVCAQVFPHAAAVAPSLCHGRTTPPCTVCLLTPSPTNTSRHMLRGFATTLVVER